MGLFKNLILFWGGKKSISPILVQHNYTQHKELQHNVMILTLNMNSTQRNNTMPLCWMSNFMYCNAECSSAGCHYDERCSAILKCSFLERFCTIQVTFFLTWTSEYSLAESANHTTSKSWTKARTFAEFSTLDAGILVYAMQ
jgi:hypothetical protein